MSSIQYHLLILFVLMVPSSCTTGPGQHQRTLDASLSWELIENDPQRGVSIAEFTLVNIGREALTSSNWKLYFSQMGTGYLQESLEVPVRISHLNGDWICLSPEPGFHLEPGKEMRIRYAKRGRIIKEVEAPAGPYLVQVSEGKEPVVLELASYQVKDFPDLEKIFPPSSGVPLPDAEWIYTQHAAPSAWTEPDQPLILPQVQGALYGSEFFEMDPDVSIAFSRGLESEASYLRGMLEGVFGTAPGIIEGGNVSEAGIRLLLDDALGKSGSYRLEVDPKKGVSITGQDPAGVFYGVQSLLAMLPTDGWKMIQAKLKIKSVRFSDSPAFAYRGIMLDVSRNFHSIAEVQKLLDAMALYKLNKLHLSLTNDEAWRIEIPGLPELTELGAMRGHMEDHRDRLIPAYGSGPFADAGQGKGSGYYSRDEFIALLKFAQTRHIQIIPEINFPGHARAAIYAMELRYERLMAQGKQEEADRYRLVDPEDASVYNSAQNFHDNVVCVCKEAPYRFYETVVDELRAMYSEAGLVLETVHAGGDEVPEGSWTASPICKEFVREHPQAGEIRHLQVYFEGRILELLRARGIQMAAWEEAALKKDAQGAWQVNPEYAGGGMLAYVWNSLGSYLDLGNRIANAQYPVILCNVDNLYFDLAYTHHPKEPGLYWGGYVDSRRTLEFAPYDVFASTLTDAYRRELKVDFTQFEALNPGSHENIWGIQAQIWSETIRDSEMLEYYYLPKLLSLAERCWNGQPAWADERKPELKLAAMQREWERFAAQIAFRELPKLDHLFGGYHYRIPPPGAIIKEGMLHANVLYPGLEIRYTLDGTEPGPSSMLYAEPVPVEGRVRLKSFNAMGRSSYPIGTGH